MEASQHSARGQCACGAVHFSLSFPTLFVGHCHCRDCRAVHGAAFVTWTAVPRARFTLEGVLTRYHSSPGVAREFCATCGTHVRYVADATPDRIYVPVGLLQGPIDRAPELHVNVADAVSWCVLGDALPRYDRFD